MKKTIFTLFLLSVFCSFLTAQDHTVTLQGTTFSPKDLTINAGETVQWNNTGGVHNVNGSQQSFPDNPESFTSGAPSGTAWNYSFTFNTPGFYDYQCDVHASMGMVGTVTVLPAGGSGDVVISEIMYNDPTDNTDQYEFIELYNNGLNSVNLEGWSFIGVNFTFPAVSLAAGEFVVISTNSTNFEALFNVPSLQFESGALSNNGETIKLNDTGGNLIDSVAYDDENGWPTAADGNGASLVLCDFGSDNNDPANWIAATTATGFQINSKDVFANPGAESSCGAGISFQLGGFTLMEMDGQVELAVILSGGNANETQVTVDINSSSTATNGVDYSIAAPVTLTFPAGAVTDTQIVIINLLDDSNIEGNETVVLELLNPTNGAVITTNGQFTLTIEDNDALVAEPDNATTDVNTPVTIDILGNDFLFNGIVSIEITLEPNNGTVTVNGLDDVTYTPDQDFCGTNVFTYEICDGATCDAANVTVTVICPISYPQYDIATVTTVDNEGHPDSVDVTAELRGIIYGVDLQVNPNTIQYTLIDNTGGIGLFSSNTFGTNLAEGDEVIVRGTISEFNCLTQIEVDTLWVESTGNALKQPTVVTSLGESEESELIRINNLQLVDPSQWAGGVGGTSGFNVDVTNGTTSFLMRIDDAVDLYMDPIPPGGPIHFDAIGIGGQFDNSGPCDGGYQFLPRYTADIIDLDVATKESWLSSQIRIYPNPMDELMQIRSALNIDEINISNMLGQQMMAVKKPGNTLNVGGLGAGLYLATFQVGDEQWTTRFIKK